MQNGPQREKPVFGGLRNKGADQTAHPRSLISAFGLNFTLSDTPKTGFLKLLPKYDHYP